MHVGTITQKIVLVIIILLLFLPVSGVLAQDDVVYTLMPLREFNDKDELTEWLTTVRFDFVVYFKAGEDGIVRSNQCEDYAIALQKEALQDGYIVSIQIDTQKGHALNSTRIGNEFVFIEPSTKEIWIGAYLD